jgi:hypothetical protein
MRITSCLRRLTFGMVVSGLTLVSSRAASIPITNASFESPALSPGAYTTNGITGWSGGGPNGVWYPDAGYFTGSLPDGNQMLFVGYNDGSGVTNFLAATLQADTTYTLSYYLGNRFAGAVDLGNPIGLSQYRVSLRTATSLLASDTSGSPDAGTFLQRTFSFYSGANPAEAGAALSIEVYASGFTSTGALGMAEFDQFTLDAAPTSSSTVPEPASGILLFSAIAGVVVLRRTVKKRT